MLMELQVLEDVTVFTVFKFTYKMEIIVIPIKDHVASSLESVVSPKHSKHREHTIYLPVESYMSQIYLMQNLMFHTYFIMELLCIGHLLISCKIMCFETQLRNTTSCQFIWKVGTMVFSYMPELGIGPHNDFSLKCNLGFKGG